MHSYRFSPGPIHLVRIGRDADLYEEISRFASERGITAATVSFLGAVQCAALRYYDQETRRYQDFAIEHPLEVVSGVGNVTLLDFFEKHEEAFRPSQFREPAPAFLRLLLKAGFDIRK